MSRLHALFFALAAAVFATCAQAGTVADDDASPAGIQRFLADGDYTLAPMAWLRFCLKHPAQCRAEGASEVVLTDVSRAELEAVNRGVNGRIRQKADVPSKDSWDIDVTAGDCDDYAVQKRKELIALGWPPRALSLGMAYAKGVPHLVLTVRTEKGDLVLDNLRSEVVVASKTGYRWLKRQSAENPLYWTVIVPGRPKYTQTAEARR
ncbi:hypothetical protein IZ6_26680 [Terrihabitans soli]|uniref:Transglutaminase-like cysteine peptidase n=1 Tax=Terrihabitans soli TaxID=708113 RepID=A0A6S6QKU2_9HYPH|nr:transglutaminase-like cysteine peptidase [Terrihabitans soli]BCJ91933.1 hypothetical protein IZ6_26680 [Terrihabitans soli]